MKERENLRVIPACQLRWMQREKKAWKNINKFKVELLPVDIWVLLRGHSFIFQQSFLENSYVPGSLLVTGID